MKIAPGDEGALEQLRQVARVAVEPALGLHEIEEQHPGESREGQRVPVGARARRGKPVGESLERGAEGAEESGSDAFTGEHVAGS